MPKENIDCHYMTVENEYGDTCDVVVTWREWYDEGVRYRLDGTGDPPDGGLEILRWQTVSGQPAPDWVTDEVIEEAFGADRQDKKINETL